MRNKQSSIVKPRFYLILFYFFEVKCDQSYYTRSIFISYFDSLWIDRNRHCNESVAWFYELRPKQLLRWSKQRFPDRIAIYCEVLINCLEVDYSLRSSFFFFLTYYSFGKVGKYFQILFRDGIYQLTRVHLVLIKTILRTQSYLIMERKILLLYFTIAA